MQSLTRVHQQDARQLAAGQAPARAIARGQHSLRPLPSSRPQNPRRRAMSLLAAASAGSTNGKTTNGKAPGLVLDVDVGNVCVEPVYRSVPRPKESERSKTQARVLFLSEGNVCRSVIAQAAFQSMIQVQCMEEYIACQSKAVRDYNEGEPPEALAVQVAQQCGIAVDESTRARLFKPAEDIVDFDLLVVFDKFNAADVLKEVSVFDTIDPSARLSSRVRRLGDFCRTREVGDIDDPLYGNMGGPDELENLSEAVTDIQEACMGLMQELQELRSTEAGTENLREAVTQWLREMDNMDWMVPPMLQKRG